MRNRLQGETLGWGFRVFKLSQLYSELGFLTQVSSDHIEFNRGGVVSVLAFTLLL